jgi:hypothetical protein
MEITVEISPVGSPHIDAFEARIADRVLVASSSTPFISAARVLLSEGADPATVLIARRGSVEALRGVLGVVAGLKCNGNVFTQDRDWKPSEDAPYKALQPLI